MLGHRYADPGAPKSKKWHTNYQYYLSHPSSSYVSSGRIDSLSPAEKYDLLLEDSSWTLTRHMWNKGLKVAQMYGGVPGWFGICHGWAAASHMRIDEPGLPFYARSVNGNYRIKFYPNDV